VEEEVKEAKLESVDPDHLIPTGATLLNCACSDTPFGGYRKGKLVNLIGDSSSGKTLLGLTTFAEMSLHGKFDDYRFIFDDVEAALEFNLDYIFDRDISDRIEMGLVSSTIESFQANIMNVIKEGKPFVYVLDSFDALTSEAEEKRIKTAISPKKKKSFDDDEDTPTKGSWKTEKAKIVGEILRSICRDLKKVEGLLIIISQTRDDITAKFKKKTRTGGHALKFYSCHEMWLAIIPPPYKKKNIEIGIDVRAKVTKNKLTGKVRTVSFPIFNDYGVDDIRANVEFLVEENIWKQEKQTILADEFNIKGTIETVCKAIEAQRLEREVQSMVGGVWEAIQEDLKLGRRKKYE
jgi:RecA/RadA recombinase